MSGELIRASVHGHVFVTWHICPHNRDVCLSGVQHKGFDFNYSVAVAKVSVEQGTIGKDYCLLYGVAGCLLFRGF